MDLKRASSSFGSARPFAIPFLFFASAFLSALSAQAQSTPPAGVIVLNTVPGSPGGAVEFTSIQWTSTSGGSVTGLSGNQSTFTNDAIGRIIYFDQGYYEEIDHNQNWQNWRAGLQSRELVVPRLSTVSLHEGDVPVLQDEQKTFEGILARFPTGQSVLGPMIDTIKQDLNRLTNGQVLENGQWIAASAAGKSEAPATVGQTVGLVTFTAKDGKTYTNARIVLTDTGISAVTANGGASVSFDQLPDDLSPFPPDIRDKIRAARTKQQAAAVEANKPAPTWTDTVNSWWATARDYCVGLYRKVLGFFSSQPAAAGSESNTNAAPAVTTAPAGPLTAADIAQSLIHIKGDNGEGAGFLARMSDGPVVVTSLHIFAGNPNAKLYTAAGDQIFPGGLRVATDRDIAVFMIQDNSYHYLDIESDFTQAKAGDPAIIPGDVSARGSGDLLSVGTNHIEFTNPIPKDSVSGAPIIDGKTYKVLGVVGAPDFGSAPASPSSLIGLRIDTVPRWEPYNQYQFVAETIEIKSFDDVTRALDSFVNGQGLAHATISRPGGEPDAKYYLSNDKVRAAVDKFPLTPGSTPSPDLIAALENVAEDGLGPMQNPETYYTYNQDHIKTAVAYRKAVKAEIDALRVGGASTAPAPIPAPTPASVTPPPAPETNATPATPSPAETSTTSVPATPTPPAAATGTAAAPQPSSSTNSSSGAMP